jgi:hypothetical protein
MDRVPDMVFGISEKAWGIWINAQQPHIWRQGLGFVRKTGILQLRGSGEGSPLILSAIKKVFRKVRIPVIVSGNREG